MDFRYGIHESVLLHTQKENVPMKDIDFYKRNTGISKPGHKYNYCPFTFWSQIKTCIILWKQFLLWQWNEWGGHMYNVYKNKCMILHYFKYESRKKRLIHEIFMLWRYKVWNIRLNYIIVIIIVTYIHIISKLSFSFFHFLILLFHVCFGRECNTKLLTNNTLPE